MQGISLIKSFALLFGIVSIYQLSFTFISSGLERKAENAAISLNKKVGAILKSLLFKSKIKKELYLCLISGDKYLSLEKISKIIGNEIIKASANECKKITGFSIGAVSPFAHSTPPERIFIDENLKKMGYI